MDISQLLEKFDNGQDKYLKDPLFRTCIQWLKHGVDVYKIIEFLIERSNSLEKMNIERLKTSKIPHNPLLIPEEK